MTTVRRTESSRSAACCRSLRRPTTRTKPGERIPRVARRASSATPRSRTRSSACGRRTMACTARGKSGTNSAGTAPWWRARRSSGSCARRGLRAWYGAGGCARRSRQMRPGDAPRDLVQRAFRAERPNQPWVADFRTSRRGAAWSTWRSSSMSARVSSWAGGRRARCERTSRSTP